MANIFAFFLKKYCYLVVLLAKKQYLCTRNMARISLHTRHSELLQNMAKLFSANVLAQAVALLVYPILTRQYAPEDFGLLSLFLNIGNILILVSTMEYQYAILLSKEARQSRAATQLSLLCALAWTVMLTALLPFRGHIAALLHIEHNTSCFLLLPLFVIAGAGWNIANMYLTRRKSFGAISRYKISNTLLLSLGKLGFGRLGFTSWGLIVSTVAASLLSLLLVTAGRIREAVTRLVHIDHAALREVAHAYRKFPVFSLPRALVNSLGIALPALILTPAFGLKELGFYSMAFTLSFMPISLVISSVQQVLFQRITEKVNAGLPIRRGLQRFTVRTLLLVLPLFVLLCYPLPAITNLLLGEGWECSGLYIRWMLPWLLMTCLNGPICFVADVFMAQGTGLIFECAILLARLAGLMTGVRMQNFDYALIGYIAGTTLVLIIQLIWYYRLISRYERTLHSSTR